MKNDKGKLEEHVVWKLCKKSYTIKSFSSTGHLERHIIKWLQKHSVNDLKQINLNFSSEDGSLTSFTYDAHNAKY